MKIIVDAMGGDNAPLEIIKGVRLAVDEYGAEAILTGDRSIIEKCAAENGISLDKISIEHTEDTISMDDTPGEIMRSKNNCSMALGLKLLSQGKADAFMSAGNSGALVVGATLITKRIRGIKRPAFAPVIPNYSGMFMLTDSGANVECRPEMLVQFGIMGSVYMSEVMGISNPRVALANVGTEDHKGGPLQNEAFALLKDAPVNFVGNAEARDVPFDACDVLVCDGFTGNVMLKMYEGVAAAMMKKIKGVFSKNLKTKLAAAAVLKDMKELKKSLDYNEYGGAPVMGVAKPVFKVHGSAKAQTVKNAFRLTMQYVEQDVIGKISGKLNELKDTE